MTRLVGRLLDQFHSRHPIRAGSLIVTVYGDAIAPRGGTLWLGSLLAIMNAFRIGNGLVRTAMSRLASDGWVERSKLGRNAYYRLAEKGRTAFDAATRRIYFSEAVPWSGSWRLVVLGGNGGERARRRELLDEAGYGAIAPNVLLAPGERQLPRGIPGPYDFTFLAPEPNPAAARRAVVSAWPLTRIAEGYRRFIKSFSPLEAAGRTDFGTEPLTALVARIMLIHEYRRIVLRDPQLPVELLPADWPGASARALCATIYRSLVPPSERWLDEHGINESGPLPPPDPSFQQRFRGA